LGGLRRRWLVGEKVPYDGGDIVAMAKLVIARERDLADADKRAHWEKAHGMKPEPAE
jgi:hypothetical protein